MLRNEALARADSLANFCNGAGALDQETQDHEAAGLPMARKIFAASAAATFIDPTAADFDAGSTCRSRAPGRRHPTPPRTEERSRALGIHDKSQIKRPALMQPNEACAFLRNDSPAWLEWRNLRLGFGVRFSSAIASVSRSDALTV